MYFLFWGIPFRELQHCNNCNRMGVIQGEKNFLKKVGKTFVNRNGNVVTLHSEMRDLPPPPQKGGLVMIPQ